MNKNNMGTDPIRSLLFKMSIPTILAQLVNLLYNIVDRIYVGRIAGSGTLALAGLGVTFPITILISAFAMLVGMGGAPRASIAMGEKNNDKAERILGNCIVCLLFFSIILSIVFYVTKEPILMAFGASEDSLPYAIQYISIYLMGTIFVQAVIGLNMFITNQGFTKISMATVCIGAILNIILDPIFIFVLDLGVRGAALATIISQAISAIWVLSFLMGKKTILKVRLKNLIPNASILMEIFSLGISPFVMQATECLIQLTFNRGMRTYGDDSYVALMSVLFSLMQLVWLPLSGLSQGAQPIMGYNYGANNMDRVKQTFRLLFKYALAFSMTVILIIELFPGAFISIFNSDLVDIGIRPARIFLFGMAFMGAQNACQQTFLALGEARTSMFLALLRKVILLWPLAMILPKVAGLGIWGLYIAEPVSDILAVMTTTTMFRLKSRTLLRDRQ